MRSLREKCRFVHDIVHFNNFAGSLCRQNPFRHSFGTEVRCARMCEYLLS